VVDGVFERVVRVTTAAAAVVGSEQCRAPLARTVSAGNDSFTHVYSFEYVVYTYSHTGNYDTYRIILGQLVLDGSDSSMVSAGTGGCLLDLDVLPLARLPATSCWSSASGKER